MPSISIQFHPQLNCVCIRKCPGNATCWLRLMKWNGEDETNSAAAILLPFIIMSIRSIADDSTALGSVVAILDNYRRERRGREGEQNKDKV
jgi:hypothetical protein